MVGRLLVGSCGSIFRFLCHDWWTFSGVRVAQSFVFCVMVGRLLLGLCGSNFSFLCHGWQSFSGFVWLKLQFSVSWLVDFQWGSCDSIVMFSVSWLVEFWWGSCGSIFSFLCHGWQTFSGVRVAQSLVFCVMVGRCLVGFVWLNLQLSVSWLVDFQWGSCGSIFSFLCHGRQIFSGLRVSQSLVFCVMVGRLLVGFVWLNLQFFVSWKVDFQQASCGSIFCFLCHGWQTFSGVRVAQSLVFCVIVGRLLVGFVWLNLQLSVSWLVDFQWGSWGSIFSFLCHGWQTFSGVRVAQSLVFCVMVGRLLVGFVWLNLQFSVSRLATFSGFVLLNLQFSVSWLVDFQWGSCGSIFSFLRHGWHTFSGVRVSQSLVFCVMVGRLLVGFVWLKHQFSVSWQVDFQWGSCDPIFRFLRHGWQTFSGVREAQSLVFCVKVGDFQWVRVAQSLVFCLMVGRLLVGSCGSIFRFLCHGWQTFSGVREAQSFVFCVLVGRLLVGFVWLNLQFSVSWQVDFQWASCVSIFSFLCHGWQMFSGVCVAQSLIFCVMVGRLLVGFVWLNLQFSVSWQVDFQWGSRGSIFSFLCHGWQTFSGVRVALSLVFCVMVGRLLVGFVWLNLQLSVSWLINFQWGSFGSIFSFLCHGRQIFSGLRVSQSLVFCVMVGRLLVGSCGSNFSFLCHGWQTFSGVRVAQSLVFCVMVGRLLVGSCGSNFSFLCHGWQTFSGVRVAQSLVSCVMVGRHLVGSCGSNFSFLCHGWQTFSGFRVAQSLDFCVMVGRPLVGFVCLNLQFSVSWQVDFQGGSYGSIFSFLCHGRYTFSGVRVAQSLVFCVMVGRLLGGFVWLNLQFSVSWLVDFQLGSCGSIFSFLCHRWQTFSGVRVAQSFVFCVMVGRLLVGFVWLNLQFSVSRLATFSGVRVDQSLLFCLMVGRLLVGSCDSIFRFLCHDWWTFSGVRVAQSFVFCVMVGRLLLGLCGSNFSFLCHGQQSFSGFVWLKLQFSVSWLVDFQWGSCDSIVMFSVSWLVDFWWGSCGSIFSFLCHGWQTFSGVRVAQSLVFCVMVGRCLVGFVWLNLQLSVSWLVDFQWGSCGSIFSFLCHGRQIFSGLRVSQSLVFCVMVGRLLVGFVWLNLQFFVSWQVDFQWASCGSIFCFLCHGWQTFSGVRVAQSLVFCVIVGRLLVGFVWLNLQLSVSWLVDFQWGSWGSIFSFLCHGWRLLVGSCCSIFSFLSHGWQTLVGFVWLNLQISVSWLVDLQWGSCVSIFSFLCHGRQTFRGVRMAQSLVFCVMVGILLVGFVWLNLQFSVSWLVDFQWGSCGSIFSFLCHGWQTFSWVRVAQSLVFCVIVGRLLVGFVWLNLLFSVSWLVDFQWGSCGSIFSFLCQGWRLLVGFVWINLYFSVSWLVDCQWVRVAQYLDFCVMIGGLLVGFVWLNLLFSVSWLVDFYWVCVAQTLVFCVMVSSLLVGSCGSNFSFLCHGWQTFSGVRVTQSLCFLCHGWQTFGGVRVAQSLVFCVMVGRLLAGFVWLNLQFSVSWLVDVQWGLCGSIFSFLCHGWQIFSGVRVAQSLVFCVMVGRFLVGFVCLNLQFSVLWLVDFQWGSCGSIYSFLCHGRQIFSGLRVAQSFVFCVMVGRLLVGFVWLNLQFSVSSLVDFQWGSCGSIFSCLCHGWQTFSGVRGAQSLVFCVMVGRLLVGFVWLNLQFSVSRLATFSGFVLLNLQFSVSWLVDFQWGSYGSIFSFLRHGWHTFSGVRVSQSLVFCVMVGRLLVGFVWLKHQFSVSWQVDFQWGSCDPIFRFLRHGWQTFSGVREAQSLVFCVKVGDFQLGSCGSIFTFLSHGWQTVSGFVWLNLQISVSWLVDFQWGS